eukprot:jgi/Mesen1/9444/ME000626S08702
MPGTIRCLVMEVVDLPAGGATSSFAVKVAMGKREERTEGQVAAEGGSTRSYQHEFNFPVLNLRDPLVVTVVDAGAGDDIVVGKCGGCAIPTCL